MCKKNATVWFTLSLANHYWDDLQQLFANKLVRLLNETDEMYDKRCKKNCSHNYANNPAINNHSHNYVNEMYVQRVELSNVIFYITNSRRRVTI